MLRDTSQAACRKVLEPYHDSLWKIATAGIAGFNELPPGAQVVLAAQRRVHANVLHAYMMVAAARELAGLPNVMPNSKYESTTYEFGGRVEARFKRVSQTGHSRNYPTVRALAFINDEQYELFESLWSAPIRVDIGYVLDKTGQRVERVLVVRRRGKFVDWMYPLDEPAQGATVTPITTPTRPAARVVAKREAKKAKRKISEGDS